MPDSADKPITESQANRPIAVKLAVVFVAVFALGVIGVWYVQSSENKRQRGVADLARIQMKNIGEEIDKFRGMNGRYPTKAEVDVIYGEDYVHGTLIDVWRNSYFYRTDETGTQAFELLSYGSDGLPGGEDHAADIVFTHADVGD